MNPQMTREYLAGDPETWNRWLEEGKSIELSRYGKTAGITCKIAVTADLYGDIIPYAEEAVKGISIEERVCEMIRLFVKSAQFATRDYVEFDYKFETRISNAENLLLPKESRRKRDKKIVVAVGPMVDDEGEPALLFTKK